MKTSHFFSNTTKFIFRQRFGNNLFQVRKYLQHNNYKKTWKNTRSVVPKGNNVGTFKFWN